jgi:DNA-nicking Smr family endonuclease
MISDEDGDSDRRLFREAMRGVRPLRHDATTRPTPRARRKPRARFARADRIAVLAESLADLRAPLAPVIETGDEIQFRGPLVSDLAFRRLRRGHFRVEEELDLHGLTAGEAQRALGEFLSAALLRGLRVVRIVHGKGLRSGRRGPVLRALVNDYLRRVSAVLAFASAREVDGGAGACLVLLAKRGAPSLSRR